MRRVFELVGKSTRTAHDLTSQVSRASELESFLQRVGYTWEEKPIQLTFSPRVFWLGGFHIGCPHLLRYSQFDGLSKFGRQKD